MTVQRPVAVLALQVLYLGIFLSVGVVRRIWHNWRELPTR